MNSAGSRPPHCLIYHHLLSRQLGVRANTGTPSTSLRLLHFFISPYFMSFLSFLYLSFGYYYNLSVILIILSNFGSLFHFLTVTSKNSTLKKKSPIVCMLFLTLSLLSTGFLARFSNFVFNLFIYFGKLFLNDNGSVSVYFCTAACTENTKD